MKHKLKLFNTWIVFGLTLPIVCYALGLGEMTVKSALNEPLKADIKLQGLHQLALDELQVSLASEEAFKRVGLSRNFMLTQLQFSLTRNAANQPIIRVASRDPITEPYLNFLVDLRWPQGQVLRSYTILLDPPEYALHDVPTTQIKPTAEPSITERASANLAAQTQTSIATTKYYGPTSDTDTLWKIAQAVNHQQRYSVFQVMIAIVRKNPNAFIDGNINRLLKGKTLQLPTVQEINAISPQQAKQISQNQIASFHNFHVANDAHSVANPLVVRSISHSAPVTALADNTASAPVTSTNVNQSTLSASGTAYNANASVTKDSSSIKQTQTNTRDLAGIHNLLQPQANSITPPIPLAHNADVAPTVTAPSIRNTQSNTAQLDELHDLSPLQLKAPTDETATTVDLSDNDLRSDVAVFTEVIKTMRKQIAELNQQLQQERSKNADLARQVAQLQQLQASAKADIKLDSDSSAAVAAEPQNNEQTYSSGESDISPQTDEVVKPTGLELEPRAVHPVKQHAYGFGSDLYPHSIWSKIIIACGLILLLSSSVLLWMHWRKKNAYRAFNTVEAPRQYSDLESVMTANTAHFSLRDNATVSSDKQFNSAETTVAEPSHHENAFTQTAQPKHQQDAVDPLEEATVYMAYNRFKEAKLVLNHALDEFPERTDIKVALLEVYSKLQNETAFRDVLQSLPADFAQTHPELQSKVASLQLALGVEPISAGNSTASSPHVAQYDIAEHKTAYQNEPDEIAIHSPPTYSEESLTATKDTNPVQTEPTSTKQQMSSVAESDVKNMQHNEFDELLSIKSDEKSEETAANTLEFKTGLYAGLTIKKDDQRHDGLFDSKSMSIPSEAVQTQQVSSLTTETELTRDNPIIHQNVSLDEDETDGESSIDQVAGDDKITTLLDLAQVYVDMGNHDAAREVLNEVQQKGSPSQLREAQRLMQHIGKPTGDSE
ncbi:MAG: motility hub landmark protein FimV [Gammaproteobacteria bacterium]